MEVIYYKIGRENVMIKMEMVKYQISLNQQKLTAQQVTLEQLLCLLSVKVLCI